MRVFLMSIITTTELCIAQLATTPFRWGWDSKIYPDSFKEELGSDLYCDALLTGDQDHHIGKATKNHKDTVISPLGGWEA